MAQDGNDWMSSRNVGGQQAYHLAIPRAGASAKDLSVVSFDGTEAMGEPSRFVIRLTHPSPDLPRASFVGMPATFFIRPPALLGLPALGEGRKIQGVVTGFHTLSSSKDATTYEVVLESRLAQLRNVPRCRLFLDQTAPQIIESILREHGFSGDNSHFSFTLLRQYQKRPIVTQWFQSDLEFIQYLCRRSGIWFRMDAGEYGEIIHFADDLTNYRRDPALSAPLSQDAGLESVGAEAVHALETHCKSIAQSIVVRDYNRLVAPASIETEVNLARNDKTTFGQAYAFGTLHLTSDEAKWEAQLRHEAALCEQVIYHGKSNVLGLVPGAVFRLTNKVLPDAEYGQLITRIEHRGARDTAYHNSYSSIPSDRLYRLPLNEADWPKISGTVSARIASPNKYPYAYMNQAGDYMVQFDFDRDPRQAGLNSCWMRLAKPFAGGLQTGFHFPLLDGTEVAVAFHDSDPDRPYIAHALHDSQNSDLITNQDRWMSRNEIRTQSNNKLRLEDWKGEEHIKLATEYGKSQLNLGHLVDAKKQKRGEGVELRTDHWASVRAGKGLFLSADAQTQANGQMLDMDTAQQQLQTALARMESLSEAVKQAQAVVAACDAQKTLLEQQLKGLQQAVLLASAPHGVALTSGEHMQFSAGGHVFTTAGGNADAAVGGNYTVAAGNAVSLFANTQGMKLFAGKGKVQVQAQADALELTALQGVTISSTSDAVTLNASKKLMLMCGGAYIKLEGGQVEIGSAGEISLKGPLRIGASGTARAALPLLPTQQETGMQLWHAYPNGEPVKNASYKVTFPDGSFRNGTLDGAGKATIPNAPRGGGTVEYFEEQHNLQDQARKWTDPQGKGQSDGAKDTDPPRPSLAGPVMAAMPAAAQSLAAGGSMAGALQQAGGGLAGAALTGAGISPGIASTVTSVASAAATGGTAAMEQAALGALKNQATAQATHAAPALAQSLIGPKAT